MSKTNTLSVSTLNVQGILAISPEYFKKCRAIAKYYNSQQVDIVNFQEVFFYHHLYYLKHILNSYPYCAYKPSYLGPRAGLVTFSRLPLQKQLYKEFSKLGSYWNSSIKSILGRKGLLISSIDDLNVSIVNTHFSANYSKDWDSDNQDTQILKIQTNEFHRYLNQIKGNSKYIITGDFNIHKRSHLYRKLVRNNLEDAFKDVYKTTQRGGYLLANNNHTLQIDYILFSAKDFLVTNKKYIFDKKIKINSTHEKYLSDHVGLQAAFTIVDSAK